MNNKKTNDVDPTANVIALVEANSKTSADLRNADKELMIAEIRRIDQILGLRSEHSKELGVAESKRIDAIRAVDVGAVATAAERAAQQATVLANQVGTSAETLRTLVASTAAAMAAAAAQFSAQVTERLALLERSQYKGEGRSGMADPQIEKLNTIVDALSRNQNVGTGKSEGIGWIGAVVVGSVSLLAGLMSIAAVLYAVLKP